MNTTTVAFNIADLAAAANGRKVNADNISASINRNAVYMAATEYVTNYTGTFSFLVSLHTQLDKGYGLNDSQVAGVLNCMIAEYNRSQQQAPITTTTVTYDNSKQYVADGYYSVQGNTSHRTIRLQTIKDDKSNGVKQWLSYLNGPDNTGDYLTIGTVNGNEVKLFRKNEGKYTDIVAATKYVIRNVSRLGEFGKNYATRSGNCFRCNRLLTTPESVALGLGPICAAK
jgi:hypothetical protein